MYVWRQQLTAPLSIRGICQSRAERPEGRHVDPIPIRRLQHFPSLPLTLFAHPLLFCRAFPGPSDLPVLLARWEQAPAVLAATLASQASQAQSVPSAPRAIRVAVAAWASLAPLAPPGLREGQVPWARSGLQVHLAPQARWDHTACLDLQVSDGSWTCEMR
jgi:hypothetical protein